MTLVVIFADIRELTRVSSTSGGKVDCIQSCIPLACRIRQSSRALVPGPLVILAT